MISHKKTSTNCKISKNPKNCILKPLHRGTILLGDMTLQMASNQRSPDFKLRSLITDPLLLNYCLLTDSYYFS